MKVNNNLKYKMNLLPIELYKYSIIVPSTGEQVTFNELVNFKYNSLALKGMIFQIKYSTRFESIS